MRGEERILLYKSIPSSDVVMEPVINVLDKDVYVRRSWAEF